MDDQAQARERGGRLDELPAHEDDSDVADQQGGGILSSGITADDRGTGDRTGNAQGRDVETGEPTSSPDDATPGISDFVDPDWDPGGGGSGGSRTAAIDDDASRA
jgi:hypothetical protein